MSLTIHVPKPFTKQRYLRSLEHDGRPRNRIPGGWVDDLVGLRRTIMLCPFCVNKFHPRAHQYEVWRAEWYVIAKCDGCRETSRNSRVFIHQSLHDDIGEERRSRGRWGSVGRPMMSLTRKTP